MKIFKKLTCIAIAALSLCTVSLPVSADWGKTDDGKSYYELEDGKKATGFTEIDGDTYYFDKNGNMLVGSYKIGGSYYRFKSDGKMFTGWAKNNDGDYLYYAKDGKRAAGFTEIGDATYYFTSKGIMLKGASYKISGEVYTFGTDGKLKDSATAPKTSNGTYFLNGYFGEAITKVAERKPTVLILTDDTDGDGLAIDAVPSSLKVGDSYAIGTDLYVFTGGKYTFGIRAYTGMSDEIPQIIETLPLTSMTKSERTAVYNAYVKQYAKKYGDAIDPTALGVEDDTLEEAEALSIFTDGKHIFMVVMAPGGVAIGAFDMLAVTGDDIDVSELLGQL